MQTDKPKKLRKLRSIHWKAVAENTWEATNVVEGCLLSLKKIDKHYDDCDPFWAYHSLKYDGVTLSEYSHIGGDGAMVCSREQAEQYLIEAYNGFVTSYREYNKSRLPNFKELE